ncbi:MAG: DUF1853 family protein [Myxococcota bacterium]
MNLFDYRTRAVRDLAWAIGSPPLYRPTASTFAHWPTFDECREVLTGLRPWLAALDARPAAFLQYIEARPTRRLGQYFETLIAFWLAHGPYTALRAQNMAVHEGKATVGELDFVYGAYTPGATTTVHLEVAVKFYLRVDMAADASAYIGPGLRDRFDLKLAKLRDAQSSRSTHPAAQDMLRDRGLVIDRAMVWLKGVLFEPWCAPAENGVARRVDGVPSTSLKGVWMTVDQLKTFDVDGEWFALERLQWLSGPADDQSALPRDALMAVVAESGRPVQVMLRTSAGLRRFFLVPNDFLERAQLRLVKAP